MTKQVGIIIAAILALVGAVILLRRREDPMGTDAVTGRQCVKVPKGFIAWTGDFGQTDWGAYGEARRKYLQQDPDDTESRALVDGFFKSIDVEPRGNYVRHFASSIKTYISSSQAVAHWELTVPGTLRCPE